MADTSRPDVTIQTVRLWRPDGTLSFKTLFTAPNMVTCLDFSDDSAQLLAGWEAAKTVFEGAAPLIDVPRERSEPSLRSTSIRSWPATSVPVARCAVTRTSLGEILPVGHQVRRGPPAQCTVPETASGGSLESDGRRIAGNEERRRVAQGR